MLIMLARWVGQSAASTAWFFLLSPSRTPKRQVWLHTFYKRFRKQAIFFYVMFGMKTNVTGEEVQRTPLRLTQARQAFK